MTGRLVAALRGRLALAALLGLGSALSAIGLMFTSGYLISRAALRPPVLLLLVAIVGVRFFSLSRSILRYLERLAGHDLSLRAVGALRVWLYRRLEPVVPGGLGRLRWGDVLARLTADMETMQDLLVRAITPPLVAGLELAVAAVLVWSLAPAALPGLLLPFAAVAAVSAAIPRIGGRAAARAGAAGRGRIGARVVEAIGGAPEIAMMGAGGRVLRELGEMDAAVARSGRRLASIRGALDGAATAAAGTSCALVLGLAIPRVGHGLDGVWLAALALAVLATYDGLQTLPDALERRERGRAAEGRVSSLADLPVPIRDAPGAPAPDPGALALEDVWFRFGEDQPWVLRGADLRLQPGRRTALVGASGAGKTTIAHLLVRFLDPGRGRVTIAGRDLRDLDQEGVRRLVGCCAQDAHVFDTSLFENVRLARPEASSDEVRAALERAGLGAWVASLPAGWDTPVGDRGDRLSGGQRQRLSVARALLARFPILILDEPTANLDRATADRLRRDMLAATEGTTLLVITHDRLWLDDVDAVIVLEHGRCTAGAAPDAGGQAQEPVPAACQPASGPPR